MITEAQAVEIASKVIREQTDWPIDWDADVQHHASLRMGTWSVFFPLKNRNTYGIGLRYIAVDAESGEAVAVQMG